MQYNKTQWGYFYELAKINIRKQELILIIEEFPISFVLYYVCFLP